jgi:hypothetical protein
MPEPPDNSNANEIRKSYFEAILKATRFLISAAIILFILIVIVGQELREYRTKQAKVAKQIKTTVEEKGKVVKKLDKIYKDICKEVPRDVPNEGWSFAQVFSIPGPNSKGVDQGKAANRGLTRQERALVRQWQAEEDEGLIRMSQRSFDVTFAELVEGCQRNRGDEETARGTQDTFPRRTGGIRSTTDIDALVRDEQKLAGLITVLQQEVEKQKKEENDKRKKGEPERTNSKIEQGVRLFKHIADYRNQYRRVIDLMREVLILTKQTQDLNAAKNSIPTPFGSFQIAPRLALLGLAYATILAYLSFYFTVRKIRAMADEYTHVTGERLHIPAPLWSPSSEPSSDSAPATSTSTLLSSILVHVMWLSTAAWLTFESLAIWNSTKALAFDYKPFWSYLLLAILIITVSVAVWPFLPVRFKRVFVLPAEPGTEPGFKLKRRVFVGLGVAGALGLLTLGLIRFFRRNARLPRLTLAEFTSQPATDTWIQNKKKNKHKEQVIHYAEVCGKHWPAEHNRETVFAGNKLVHAACQARILEELGTRAHNQMLEKVWQRRGHSRSRDKLTSDELAQGELAIAYFKKASALSPLSIHLYDKLRRVYGALERYDEIKTLLDHALSVVRSESALAKAAGVRRRQESRVASRKNPLEIGFVASTKNPLQMRVKKWW